MLAAGALAGALLALAGLAADTGWSGPVLAPGVVARVNAVEISREEYDRGLSILSRDKRNEVSAADRDLVLQRLIEEELLIQQGLRSGLMDRNARVRKAVTDAVVAWVLADVVSAGATESELLEFYRNEIEATAAATHADDSGFDSERYRAENRDGLEALYMQGRREAALRDYLQWLREEADLRVAR